MGFSQQLRAAREKKGMTQQQVADVLGIDKTTYSGYETGKREPDVFKIKALAKLFEVSGDELLETGFHPKQPQSPNITIAELEHIKKYRRIDSDGKKTVDMVLDQLVKAADATRSADSPEMISLPLVARGGGQREIKVTKQEYSRAVELVKSLDSDDLDL